MTQREKLIEILSKYFTIGDSDEYSCIRDKSAFALGTMSLDDFVEFDEEKVVDIADYLLANGVVLPCRCGECEHFYKYNCHSDNMRMNMCKLAVGTDGEDFYCPYGERKGGE